MAELKLSPEELRPLISEVVRAVLSEEDQGRQLLGGKLVVDEAEAAHFLGLNQWQLRDLRLAGKITYHRIVGRRIRYMLDDLLAYLRRGRHASNA